MNNNFFGQQQRAILKSFLFAFRGLRFCIKNERNMRVHIAAAVFVTAFSLVYGLSRLEYALIFLVIGLVIVCEAVNTALEAMVNLQSPSYNTLAKIAKDVAAGAVLAAAFAALLVGGLIFFKFPALTDTLLYILHTPSLLILFILLVPLGVLFIFFGDRLFKD